MSKPTPIVLDPQIEAAGLRYWWSTICVVMPTRDMPRRETFAAVSRLIGRGARFVDEAGFSCPATARNAVMTKALDLHSSHCDTFLLVDDDMSFEPDDAEQLITLSKNTGLPHAARYMQRDQQLALRRVSKDRWWAGLGLCAVSTAMLLAVAPPRVKLTNQRSIYPWCTVGVLDGEWHPEDYSLCRLLGGVIVPDISAGHIKPIVLQPPKRTDPLDD